MPVNLMKLLQEGTITCPCKPRWHRTQDTPTHIAILWSKNHRGDRVDCTDGRMLDSRLKLPAVCAPEAACSQKYMQPEIMETAPEVWSSLHA
jgi:hypothetical protein